MKLTVVGCSGSYPGPDSPASCYLLEEEHEGRTWRILLDLGNGALGALHRHADPLEIDAVFLSHLHPDHCLDLCGYHVLRKYHPDGVQPVIPVWGPAGTADHVAAAYGLPPDPGMSGEFDFHEHGEVVELGPFAVEVRLVEHPVAAYALRVSSGGRVLVYTGDTAPCDALHELASGADLLLAEASFREADDNPPGIHLTGADAGLVATRADAKRLVLTHIPPWHDPAVAMGEAKEQYAGPIDLAVSGAVHDV
jgi:ribonuclease BN (tRNA processing enzyme)